MEHMKNAFVTLPWIFTKLVSHVKWIISLVFNEFTYMDHSFGKTQGKVPKHTVISCYQMILESQILHSVTKPVLLDVIFLLLSFFLSLLLSD